MPVKPVILRISMVFIFIFSLFFGLVYVSKPSLTYFAEKLFLDWHQNELAIGLLNLDNKLSNDNFKNFYLLGRIYFVQNNLSVSLENFSKAIELNPDFKESYYGRALVFGFMGEGFSENAIRDFLKYLELEDKKIQETGNPSFGSWATYNDLAWIYFKRGDYKNSEKFARAGLEKVYGSPWLYTALGVTLVAQNNCFEAKKYLLLAKQSVDNLSVEEFGQAYSGDAESNWQSGLEQMKRLVEENLSLCIR